MRKKCSTTNTPCGVNTNMIGILENELKLLSGQLSVLDNGKYIPIPDEELKIYNLVYNMAEKAGLVYADESLDFEFEAVAKAYGNIDLSYYEHRWIDKERYIDKIWSNDNDDHIYDAIYIKKNSNTDLYCITGYSMEFGGDANNRRVFDSYYKVYGIGDKMYIPWGKFNWEVFKEDSFSRFPNILEEGEEYELKKIMEFADEMTCDVYEEE